MKCDKRPETGMPIYLNGCGCQLLWEQAQNIAKQQEVPHHTAKNDEGCDCKPPCNFEGWPLAMAFVPMQPWETPFDFEEGLKEGTIFPGLRLPFGGGGCR